MPRGKYKAYSPSENPTVTIGLSLSTSPSILSSSSTEPFYIIVTARILKTPHPDQPITLVAHLSPLDRLTERGFENIVCTTDPSKKIEIYGAAGWQNYKWDPQNLRGGDWGAKYKTIPANGQGSLTIKHEVPRDLIEAANVKKGENYRVAMTDSCLGTMWWAFASLDELEGVRLRAWKSDEDDAKESEDTKRERLEKYGDGPTNKGEKPTMLALVPENEIEFEVV